MNKITKKQFNTFLCFLLIATLSILMFCSCSATNNDNVTNSNTELSTESTTHNNDAVVEEDSTTTPDKTEEEEQEDEETTETLKPDGDIPTNETNPSESEGDKVTEDNKTEETKPNETKPHSHNYTSKTTKNATCTSDGEKKFTCKCGYNYTETIKATGHKHILKSTKNATCTVNGEKKYECPCGDKYTETIKASGHKHVLKSTKNATCITNGEKKFACACGDTYTENIKATGHSWSNWKTVKEPTTSSEGTSQRKCNSCSATESKPISKLPSENPSNDTTVSKSQLQQIEEGFLMLVNYERNRVGVPALTSNSHLETVAQTRSNEIISTWSHTRPNGQPYHSLVDTNQYRYIIVGENICMTSHVGNGTYTDKDKWTGSASQIEAAYSWIYYCFRNSSGHYANMIDGDFENCGIGISYVIDSKSGLPMFYVSHIFGTK